MHYGWPLTWPLTSETSLGHALAVGGSPMIHWGHSVSTHVAAWLCKRPLIIHLMSVRGWPRLTLFSIPLSICLSGFASLSRCKKTINSPRYVTQSYWLDPPQEAFWAKKKACVLLTKKIPTICALPVSCSIYSMLYNGPRGGPSLVKDRADKH